MSGRTVLIYTHALAGGGAERVCAVLAREFRHRGWRVLLAVDSDHPANLPFVGSGVDVRVLGSSHMHSIGRLARILREERPDVSLSAMSASNLKHAAAAVLAGRRKRAVLSYHAFAPSEPQRLSQVGYRLLPLLSRITARTAAVSDDLRRNLVTRWRADARRTVTLYNPVQVGPDVSRAAGEGAPPLVLAAGRLVPDKNMVAIVRAFARVASRGPAQLTILGEGPERDAIVAEATRLGLGDRVELPGYLSEPWELYRRAACFVTASRLESFSMVVAEALSYGLPVVACDSPGPREILDGGRYGALVPPDDEAALGEAIWGALEAPGNESLARERGRQFSVVAGISAYERLFDAVVAEARNPHLGPGGRA